MNVQKLRIPLWIGTGNVQIPLTIRGRFITFFDLRT